MTAEKVKILYLDDNSKKVAEFLSNFSQRYTVLSTASSQEAIEFLKTEPIAVIIGSQEMKSMDSLEFFESILHEYPDSIRLIVSETNDAEALINAINKGQVFRYIAATSDSNELQQSIDVGVKIFSLERKKRQQISQMQEESLKRERILSLFSRYVPRQVVDEALSKDTQNVFGGEQRNITILFAAIKDLTRLTESISPDKTLPYLNSYFSFISQCVEEHKGIVDKLIGDTFLALFGAPLSYLNNEANATFCALDILEKLKKFNEEHAQPMGFQTEISIGIHCGEAIIGNIGSHQYISYTAVGDTVNTTSRILGIAKKTPNTILISQPLHDAIQHENFVIQPIGTTIIRGKEQPMDLFQVMGKSLAT